MNSSKWKIIDILAYILLLVGALNWGLVGLFGFDLVASLFGPMTLFSRMVYALVGLAAVYDILTLKAISRRWHVHFHEPARA